MEKKSQSEQSYGTFDMETKTISFNEKLYEYTKEQLCSDNQSLMIAYSQFNSNKSNDIFPQGNSYIDSLFETKIRSNEKVIILSNEINGQTTWFYFPLIQYEELCYSGIYRTDNITWITKKFEEYKNDNFPQGREYCSMLINGKLKEGECFYILVRKDGEKWTRYYFKSNYIKINPSSIYLKHGEKELNSELEFIKNSNKNLFPQGINHCVELINNQIKTDGDVFVINSFEPNFNKMVYSYYLTEDVMKSCEHVGRNKSYLDEIQNTKNRDESPSDVIPQGYQYVIKLLNDLMENGGAIRIFIKKTNKKTFWFYFGDNI